MMSELLLRTKLSPPLVPQALVTRQHLLNKLDEGLLQPDGFGRRLTLISAPPGYGKTCLTVEWLQEGRSSFAWLALDEEDNDPARFLLYLLAALQHVDPVIGSETQALLGLPQPPPAEVILTTLINEFSTLDSLVILVLDDYHLIQLPPIHQQMTFLVEHQPKCLHLVILGREDPPLPLHRLRARRQMLEIHQDDLRFSSDESLQFFHQVMQISLSDQIIKALTLRTEGWITGLQLAAISLRYHPDKQTFVDSFSGSNRYVLDYLFEEVYQQQAPEVQSFLLATSILNRLTPSLCDALTGRHDGSLQLQMLEKANLFISPLDDERQWYRYQQLFADLLQHLLRLSAELSESQLHMRASQWYWRNGYLRQAVRHALAAENWEYASQLIAECADSLLKRGEIATLLNWFAKIPESIIHINVGIGLTYAWALMLSGQFKTAASILRQAEQLAKGDRTAIGGVAAAQVFLAQSLGDGKRLIEKSHQALALLPADDLTQRGNVALGLGIAYWHIGQLTEAQQALEEALQDCQRSDNFYGEISSRVFLARTLAVRGYLRQAFPEFEALVQPAEKLPILPLIYLDLGTLHYEWDNLEDASRCFCQALESSQRIGNLEFQVVSMMLQALLILAQGDRGAALNALERAGQIAHSRDVPARTQTRFIDLRLQFALRLGDFKNAQQLASQLSGEGDCHPFYRFLGLTDSRLLLATGQRHKALDQLVVAVETARTNDWGYGLVAALALQAVAHEHTSSGLECLQQALSLAQPQGYLRTFADIGEPLVPLLQEAARRNLMPAYIGQITSAMKSKTQLAVGSEKLVEPLSVREVEVLRLLVAGFSNREIADKLVLSLGTVKSHIHNIYGKLEVRSRTQAIQRATELELL
jgi:LuxR family maltose regulon positive regulatory protein